MWFTLLLTKVTHLIQFNTPKTVPEDVPCLRVLPFLPRTFVAAHWIHRYIKDVECFKSLCTVGAFCYPILIAWASQFYYFTNNFTLTRMIFLPTREIIEIIMDLDTPLSFFSPDVIIVWYIYIHNQNLPVRLEYLKLASYKYKCPGSGLKVWRCVNLIQ